MRRRTRTIRRRYGRAEYLAKPLAMPNVKSFDELFSSARAWQQSDSGRGGTRASRGGREANTISGYLTMGGGKSMFVTPSRMLIDYISENMLALGDSIYFEIVARGGGKALVIAKHNKIIGSRWLALISKRSIPKVGG